MYEQIKVLDNIFKDNEIKLTYISSKEDERQTFDFLFIFK